MSNFQPVDYSMGFAFNRIRLRWLAYFAAFGLLGLLQPAPALAGGIEQLREFSKTTRTARGEFQQKTLKASGQIAESTSGRFAFSKPGQFRWEVRAPFEQLMVADGEKIYFFDKDLNQVTVRKISDSLGASPAAILFGDGDLAETFELKESGSRDGLEWIEAKPKSKEAGFELINIGLRAGKPDAMEVIDSFGRRTQFAFKQLESNPKIAVDQFKFVAPAGAEIVQQ
jgi:outer membrane lipoprotein carrier protein